MKEIQEELQTYYQQNLENFGPGARGVGWKSEEAQCRRFDQLLKIINDSDDFTINDLGCGVGHLFQYLDNKKYNVRLYTGYDTLQAMLIPAIETFRSFNNAVFNRIETSKDLRKADYTVASGIFNLKYSIPEYQWLSYVLETIHFMNVHSVKGFAFNMLTTYSDKEYTKEHLYYADPVFFFEFCKKNFSRNVALLHDYDEYDFTILVRK